MLLSKEQLRRGNRDLRGKPGFGNSLDAQGRERKESRMASGILLEQMCGRYQPHPYIKKKLARLGDAG